MKRCLFKDVQTRQRVRRILEGSGKRRMRTGGIFEHLQYSLKRLSVPLDSEGGRMAPEHRWQEPRYAHRRDECVGAHYARH